MGLKNRWCNKISHDVQKFESLYARVVALGESGKTEENMVDDAILLFKEDTSWNESKRDFAFLSCWEILRRHPKWGFNASNKRKSYDGRDEEESTSFEANQGRSRPAGRKCSKLAVVEEHGKKELLAATQRMAAASERRAAALELLGESQYSQLFSEESGCTKEERNEYLTLMRRKILLKMRGDNIFSFCFKSIRTHP